MMEIVYTITVINLMAFVLSGFALNFMIGEYIPLRYNDRITMGFGIWVFLTIILLGISAIGLCY